MDQLKLVAQALGLALESPVEKVLEAIKALDEDAKQGRVWKVRAEENLSKLESDQGLIAEIAVLKADAVIEKAKAAYKITAAEAIELKELYLSGPKGQGSVTRLIAARADQEYLTRSASLRTTKTPTDPLAEIESRSAELIAKDPKLSKSDANTRVLDLDPDLANRYRLSIVKGAGGAE